MAVTVGELIEGLKALDPSLLVVLADSGETFSPLSEEMGSGLYVEEEGEGRIYGPQDVEDDPGTPSLVFYPGDM